MDKIAMIKQAEVNGVVAALLETELVKVANEEDFDIVTGCVAENLSDDYDMEEVFDKTASVMEEYYELLEEVPAGVEKVAEVDEVDEGAIMAAYGELTLAKEAGEISEDDFAKEAASLKGIVDGAKVLARDGYNGQFKNGWRFAKKYSKGATKNAFKATKLREYLERKGAAKAVRAIRNNAAEGSTRAMKADLVNYSLPKSARPEKRNTSLFKGLAQLGAAYGGTGAAAGGAAYGGKKLYDKYKK